MKKILLFIFFILLTIGYFFVSLGSKEVPTQDFIISKWDTLYTLPKKLDINVNSTLYKAWIKIHHSDFVLQAWSYKVQENITLDTLFTDILPKPLAKDLTITILPGWNIYDIDEYFAKSGLIKSWELISFSKEETEKLWKKYSFLKNSTSLEGFLYPDTYRIRPESTLWETIDILLEQFQNKIIDTTDIESSKLYLTLILASIVEREERNSPNKRIVAGVLAKRLKEGIALGADATVCYPFWLTQKECTPNFIGEYVYEKSDYNTRKMSWLPPTPISNVSADTFDATAHPQSSNYYYYLHDNDWVIHFAEDLAGHNANRVKYLRK